MSDLVGSVRSALKLEAARDAMKGLYGERWDEKAEPFRAVLNGVMATEGCGVLAAALPIAKVMRDAGESPVLLLAVAAEMCEGERETGKDGR